MEEVNHRLDNAFKANILYWNKVVSWELMSTIMNVVIIIGILIGIATSTEETSGEFAVAILLLSAVGE